MLPKSVCVEKIWLTVRPCSEVTVGVFCIRRVELLELQIEWSPAVEMLQFEGSLNFEQSDMGLVVMSLSVSLLSV